MLELTDPQLRMIDAPCRFDVTVAGRRGGKTFGTGTRLLIEAGAGPNRRIGYMAPTYQMSKRLMWDWLRQHTPPDWIRSMNKSELTLELQNGSRIMLFTGERFDAVRGLGFDHFEFDEMQDIPLEAWTEVVRPALSDRQGSAGFKGTPKGTGNALFDLYREAGHTPGWSRYTYTTRDGGLVALSEIEAARSQLDERTFRQEYEASFETSGAIVYYAFDDTSIIDSGFRAGDETVMAWDFNSSDVKPMVCLLLQRRDVPGGKPGDTWVVTKEFVYRNSNTVDTCQAIERFFEEQRFVGTLAVTGDYAGNRRESNATQSDYRIIENFFRNRSEYRRKCRVTKAIRDRVAATNSAFRSADGTRKLFVDRSCTNLIEDLQRTQWKESGQGLDPDGGKRTDESDALSYFPYNWYPVDKAIPSPTFMQ